MPRVAKEKPAHMDPAVVAAAHAKVEANPRGAPITGDDIIVGETPLDDVAAYVAAFDAVLAPAKAEAFCALQDAPVGSKIVVSRDSNGKHVRLITPTETMELPSSDIAYSLPEGAKIRKRMAQLFEAERLNAPKVLPPMASSTAQDAVRQYRTYFHPDD